MTIRNRSVLVISDLHIPYHHKDSFNFLKAVKRKFKPDRVVNIGDLLDFHSISMHEHNPDLPSVGDELDMAREHVEALEKIFPEVTEVHSNHSSLVYRRALKFGMSKQFLKPYGEFLGTGKGWTWVDDLTIELSDGRRCHFTHGKSADVLKTSQSMGMSCVQGHYHTKLSVSYWANPDNIFWGMQVGCLINQKSMAFEYAKNFNTRFMLGCGVIIDGVPRAVPMILNLNGDWIGEVR